MAHEIDVRVTITVRQGPKVATSRTLTLDAYDILDVTVPGDGAAHVVEVQPDDGAQVRLLVLTASSYDADLTWEADESGTSRALDEPLVLAGQSLASLLGSAANTIAFTNATGTDVDVQILVAREAVA